MRKEGGEEGRLWKEEGEERVVEGRRRGCGRKERSRGCGRKKRRKRYRRKKRKMQRKRAGEGVVTFGETRTQSAPPLSQQIQLLFL